MKKVLCILLIITLLSLTGCCPREADIPSDGIWYCEELQTTLRVDYWNDPYYKLVNNYEYRSFMFVNNRKICCGYSYSSGDPTQIWIGCCDSNTDLYNLGETIYSFTVLHLDEQNMVVKGDSGRIYTFVRIDLTWEFQHEEARVAGIKLVEMQDDLTYSVVKEPDTSCASELFAQIDALDWKSYGPDLKSPSDMCFLIVYDNGEYDLLSHCEPRNYQYQNGKIVISSSWLCCDEEEFKQLVLSYYVD